MRKVFTLMETNDIENGSNFVNAKITGIEGEAKWSFNQVASLLFSDAYDYIRVHKNQLNKSYVDSAPRNTVSALLINPFNQNWDSSLAYYLASEATQLVGCNPRDLIRSCDARVAKRFKADNVRGVISILVENIFNTKYQELAVYNTLGRRACINVKLDF